jgi:hypothetical protein
MSKTMSSDLFPRQLNISGTSARDGAQAFAGINLGSIHFADTGAHQSQSIMSLESIFTLTSPVE